LRRRSGVWGDTDFDLARCRARDFGLAATPFRACAHRSGRLKANDLTITRKNGEWFARVTLRVSEDACARARTGGAHPGVDFVAKTMPASRLFATPSSYAPS
jgi:hypothetical protein